jgi:hypothetical protein
MLKIFLGGEEEAIPEEEEAISDTPGEEEANADISGKVAMPNIPRKEAIPNIPTPRDVMDKAISGPEYEKLVVFD